MRHLDTCPDWPAVMDREVATLYLGGKKTLLFTLVALGHLRPLTEGHRNTAFIRRDMDAALAIVSASPAQIATVPVQKLNSIEAAIEWRDASGEERKRLAA